MKHENLKIVVVVMALLTIFFCVGCPKPPEPPNPDDPGKALTAAMNTACTMDAIYITVDRYYPMAKQFIPPDIKKNVVFFGNAFHSALNAYNSAVDAWYTSKMEPSDWNKILQDLQNAYKELQPLIIKIIEALKENDKLAMDEALKAGIITCDYVEFKAKAAQVKDLPALVE